MKVSVQSAVGFGLGMVPSAVLILWMLASFSHDFPLRLIGYPFRFFLYTAIVPLVGLLLGREPVARATLWMGSGGALGALAISGIPTKPLPEDPLLGLLALVLTFTVPYAFGGALLAAHLAREKE